MTDRYKFYGSNHVDGVPQDILARRVDQIDDREAKNRTTKFIAAVAAGAAALTLLGINAVKYNHAHETNDSPATPHAEAGPSR